MQSTNAVCAEKNLWSAQPAERKGNQQFVMGIMYRAVSQKKPEEVMEPTLYECHFCGGGNYGVADFLGFKLNDKEDTE